MSMFNLIFGSGPSTGLGDIEALVEKLYGDVGRYRSAWIERDDKGELRFAVYTRNGGGNREHYDYGDLEEGEECYCTGCIISEHIPSHPLYLYDVDDDYDCTYCTIYFKIPQEAIDTWDKESPDWRKFIQGEVNMSEVWTDTIDNISKNLNGN